MPPLPPSYRIIPDVLAAAQAPATADELNVAYDLRQPFLLPCRSMPYMDDVVRGARLLKACKSYIELLRQFGQRPLAPHGSQCHLRLESRTMVRACALRHLISCSVAILAAFRQKLHLADCADLTSHLCKVDRKNVNVSYVLLLLQRNVAPFWHHTMPGEGGIHPISSGRVLQ